MLLPPPSNFLLPLQKNSRNKPEMRKNEKKQSFSIIKIVKPETSSNWNSPLINDSTNFNSTSRRNSKRISERGKNSCIREGKILKKKKKKKEIPTKRIRRRWGTDTKGYTFRPTSHFRRCIYERPAMNGPEQVLNLMQ